jgi:hypothetical protein
MVQDLSKQINGSKIYKFVRNQTLYICRFVRIQFLVQALKSVKLMHISIADDIKKRFHAAYAIRGLKISQVITELVEQWLKANEVTSLSDAKA